MGRPKKKKADDNKPIEVDYNKFDNLEIGEEEYDETNDDIDWDKDTQSLINSDGDKEYVEMIHNAKSTDRSIYELQMDDIINEIEITYRGLKYDVEKGKYYRGKDDMQVMTDKGVSEIIKILKSILHKGMFMSKFKDVEANNIFMNIGKALNVKLCCSWRVWGIKGQDSVIMIYNELLANIKAGINRAINSEEKHYREKAMGYNVGVNTKVDAQDGSNNEMFIGGI